MYIDEVTVFIIGLCLIILLFLLIFIPCTTNKINPNAKKLERRNLINSLRKQEYKIKQKMSTASYDEVLVEIMHQDTLEKISDIIDWNDTKNIQQYELSDKIVLVIPDIVFNDWNILKGKKVKRIRGNGVDVQISKKLLEWTRIFFPKKKYSQLKQHNQIHILSYHSGCFLAYGLYCLLDNVHQVKMFGPAKFFDFDMEHHYLGEIDVFLSLNDIWSKLPFDSEASFWGGGIQIALNENDYKDMNAFRKIYDSKKI